MFRSLRYLSVACQSAKSYPCLYILLDLNVKKNLLLVLHHQGVLRIHFLEAQELLGKDKFLGGLIKGKSDPYGVIKVGTSLFKSKVIHETVNPKWNEVYEVGEGLVLLDYCHYFDIFVSFSKCFAYFISVYLSAGLDLRPLGEDFGG